jgi:hypothetical protein
MMETRVRWRGGSGGREGQREERKREGGGSEGYEECSLNASINGFRGVSHFH